MKNCIIAAMEDLLNYHRDKPKIINEINQMQLSRRTIVRRAEIMSQEIERMHLKTLDNSLAFSICLDESTDRNDVSQLVVFARMADEFGATINQPLGLIPVFATTTSSVRFFYSQSNSFLNFQRTFMSHSLKFLIVMKLILKKLPALPQTEQHQ